MFRKEKGIEMQNYSPTPLINPTNTHLSTGGWVHMVFLKKIDAETASTELKMKGLVDAAPKVQDTHKNQTYGLGKFFIRIHESAYPAISQSYELPTLQELGQAHKSSPKKTR